MSTHFSTPPQRDLSPAHLTLRAEHLRAEIAREQQPRFAFPRLTMPMRAGRRTMLATAVVALALPALALSGIPGSLVGWLTGSPAPPSVVADFGTYAPQLGFQPDPGSSLLVATAGDSQLYATTNAEGTYCVVASAPWKRPDQNPDGGYCVGEKTAAQPIVAGIVGGSSTTDNAGNLTLLVAGRISVAGAASVNITLPDGSTSNVKLGSSGFFLSEVPTQLCASGDWSAKLDALDAQGNQLVGSTITLEHVIKLSDGRTACWLPPLTSEAAPSVHVGP